MGFLGILGRVLAPFARPIEGLVDSVLKVRMMVPIVLSCSDIPRNPAASFRSAPPCINQVADV
jgi:hypothetical protein